MHRSVKPLEAGRRRRAYRDIFIACLSGRCILFKSLGSKPRKGDRFIISIFIFSITAISNMVYFGTLRFFA